MPNQSAPATSSSLPIKSVQPRAGVSGEADSAMDSQDLLRGTREVLIRHGGDVYRLRHTRNDKLILTK